MQRLDGELILSATDLTGFAACRHLTRLELAAASGALERPSREDPMLDVLGRKGDEHEAAYLARLRAEGRSVVEISNDSFTRAELVAAEAATLAAMRDGVDVIYQATFFDGRWRGHADFLFKVDTPSALGHHSYEVADAKLAVRVKAAAIVQMCSYSEHVERLQGRAPEHIHVLTGDGEQHSHLLRDAAAYYRSLKARCEALVAADVAITYPDPVDHCGICRWNDVCIERRRTDDHLSLVSGMRRDHTRKLVDAGVATRRALAALPPDTPVARIQEPVLERLRQQAELQVRSEGVDPPFFELLEPEAPDPVAVANGGGWRHRGFAALPEPSPGDVFFDMEGDRFALEGGLEYLFGVVYLDDAGEAQYRDFWAHDREDEGRAFEQFVDWLGERRRVFPELHVYHYAPYEPVALKRLMGMHGTREAEVDELLRGEAFVDLYAVFRQGVRYGSESYSLKQVERLYTARPEGEVMDAGASVVAYEHYLADHDPQRLEAIRAYNEDDCRSAYLLRDWLEGQREVLVARLGPMARPAPGDGAPSEQVQERDERAAELTDQLLDGLPAEADDRTADDQARWLLAHLLQFHRREEKPDWWAYFQQRDYLGDDDFLEDRECIGGLELDGVVGAERKSTVVRYRFPPQDHKFGIGSEPFDPFGLRPAGRVARVDDIAGTIDLVRGPSLNDVPHPRALMPRAPVSQNAQADAIVRVAEAVLTDGLDTPGYQAACDLLRRRPPRLVGTLPVGPIARRGEHGGDAARRVVGSLDHTSLAVQGPPGSGKTYTGARMIVDLVRSGKRVGITAHSHAAIGNLLDAMCEHAAEAGVKVRALQKAEDHQRCTSAEVECVGGNDEVVTAIGDDRVDVVAGTSWLWARADMAGSVDVLFVDEAGQKSLADVVAMSGAAESVVLLGDPQQLAQPSKGAHPKGAEASALAHLLGDAATLPEDLGLFLGTTYRMHPAVCAFVSEVAYDERLHSEPGLEGQAIAGEAGLRLELVEHRGNRSSSLEEAEAVDALVHAQMGRPWTDADVRTRPLMLDDVLVIAPYNAQVAMLQQHLPAGARVGTVDKFQGREAPLTIYSMATSTPDDIPRGMDFLYDLHRLNVAVSRARAMCVLVCSPALFDALCRTPEQVRLANALCRYRELAAPPS